MERYQDFKTVELIRELCEPSMVVHIQKKSFLEAVKDKFEKMRAHVK